MKLELLDAKHTKTQDKAYWDEKRSKPDQHQTNQSTNQPTKI